MATSSAMASSIGQPPADKLTLGNHLLWKAQILSALRGARVLGWADGSELVPPEKLEIEKDGKTMSVPNPAYDTWLMKDRASCSSKSKANVTHLRGALSNTKKLNMSADQYIAKIKGFATERIAAGRTIDDDELRDLILNGLGEDYNGVVAAVNAMTSCSGFESSVNSASRRRSYKKNNHGRPRVREEDRGRNGGGERRPHKEDMAVDVVVDHHDSAMTGSATTSSAKYAREKAMPRPHAGGTTQTETTTTTKKSTLPMVWIPIGIPTLGQPATSPTLLTK
ncbi:hypothetical protein QYE76_056615 [Lolium multiflorum]|uniref:Uncharacterized protein n=1 Tax=Lolium multiflorum TaxID=4521 RepID=A0AAD8WNA6_LOLMU|nr:hypothetical protein QYE76_056615 [Lolium multiflorum]